MSQGVHLRKYGVETTIEFELYEVDGVDLRTDWTPAAADCEIEKDGGGYTQCVNTASGTTTYRIVLTGTEMEFARGVLKIVDAATKAFLDKVVVIETYGNASAQHAFDLDIAGVDVISVHGSPLAETTPANLADNISAFFDNADSAPTAKVVDDIGGAASIGGALSVSGAGYVGDYELEDTLHFAFSTTGTLSNEGNGIRVFKDDSDTQLTTAQVTLDEVDGETNMWQVSIALGAANYDKNTDYQAVLSGATIGGNTVTAVVGTFSIENRYQEPVHRQVAK